MLTHNNRFLFAATQDKTLHSPLKIYPSISAANLLKLGEDIEKLESAGADEIHFADAWLFKLFS